MIFISGVCISRLITVAHTNLEFKQTPKTVQTKNHNNYISVHTNRPYVSQKQVNGHF